MIFQNSRNLFLLYDCAGHLSIDLILLSSKKVNTNKQTVEIS